MKKTLAAGSAALAGGALVAGALIIGTSGGWIAAAGGTPHPAPTDRTAVVAAPPDPADFSHPVANTYFPLVPGTITRLDGTDEGARFHERSVVTHGIRTIQGVRTTVVYDVTTYASGVVAEKTYDWYAADNEGTVWYFGEATATYDRRGRLQSREGSWQAGSHGAVAGRIMPAQALPTTAYRQEYQAGVAEDQAWIVNRGELQRVPAGTFGHVLRSYEWSRLEPGVVSVKFYAPHVGIVKEQDVAGGSEVFRLVSVTH